MKTLEDREDFVGPKDGKVYCGNHYPKNSNSVTCDVRAKPEKLYVLETKGTLCYDCARVDGFLRSRE
ncbi:MAG: hypothetical protein WCP89_01415 [archaeon]